ncbi:MAG TPA: cytochrome c maturation protein CcmE [Dehalococcoidia bacterium]|nr:cytochrome c maturation protein CcmE [Dehalococcoidia bacterium]
MKKKYLIGGVILILVVGYLLYLSFGSSVSYYLTVSEFLESGSEFHDTNVRVAGKIADSPVDWNAADLELRFDITEGGRNLPVIYQGAKPSGFKVGSNILVEGKGHPDGVFRASQIIMKCPSKYEPVE